MSYERDNARLSEKLTRAKKVSDATIIYWFSFWRCPDIPMVAGLLELDACLPASKLAYQNGSCFAVSASSAAQSIFFFFFGHAVHSLSQHLTSFARHGTCRQSSGPFFDRFPKVLSCFWPLLGSVSGVPPPSQLIEKRLFDQPKGEEGWPASSWNALN